MGPLCRCSDRIRAHSLELIEASGMSVQDIQADALARRYEIVYIDYLQLVEPETRKTNRTEQVSGISRGLQQLAHGHGMLVVALSQLSRADKAGEDKLVEPTMVRPERVRADRAGRGRHPAALPGRARQAGQEPPGAEGSQKQGGHPGEDLSGL